MPQKYWVSEGEKRNRFYAYGARMLWEAGYDDYAAFVLHQDLEDRMAAQEISPEDAQEEIDFYESKWPGVGYKAKVVDVGGHGIIVPYKQTVERVVLETVTATAIIGDRGQGKTTTNWLFNYRLFYKVNQHAEIHSYGDIDNVARRLKDVADTHDESYPEEVRRLGTAIVLHPAGDYSQPPEPPVGMWQIMNFNEMDTAEMGKRALSEENVTMNLLAFRLRHLRRPIFFNIVDYGSFEGVLRRMAPVKLFKHMSGDTLDATIDRVPKAWRDIIMQIVPHLKLEEALAIFPIAYDRVRKDGSLERVQSTAVEIYTVNAPSWYLRITSESTLNKEIAYGRRGIPMEAAMDAMQYYKNNDVSLKVVAEAMNNKWNLRYSPREWGRSIKELDPEYSKKTRKKITEMEEEHQDEPGNE